MRVLVALGTRPEIIKLAPVVTALRDRRFHVRTVATGQHFDPGLADVFFEGLGLDPDCRWEVKGEDGDRVGRILSLAFREIGQRRPDLVLLLGDTYTVPLFALAARHYQVPIAHIEAGMRSFNQTSIEESNRRIVGALASLHLAATRSDAEFLHAEGVAPARIRVVGNPVLDAVRASGALRVPPERREGIVATVHRRSNVDDAENLERVVRLLGRLADEHGPIVFPVHPRTRDRMEAAGVMRELDRADIQLLPPQPYSRMLELVSHARVVVTDSGGLQEEAAWFGVPVVVLRRSTPRWDGVRAGISTLCGLDDDRVLAATKRFVSSEEQQRVAGVACPYGDGHCAARVAELLRNPEVIALLSLEEPDFVERPVPTGPQDGRAMHRP